MTARASFEAACHAAITKHRHALADGTYRVTADNALVDAILKAADVYALGATIHRQKAHVNAKALDEALASIRATTPEARADILAASRTDIGRQPTYGTKKAAG